MTEAKSAKLNKCCSSNCLLGVPQIERENFRRNFKLCDDMTSRIVFIMANISEKPIDGKLRKCVRTYRCGAHQVCLNTFCSLLEITTQKVKIACSKIKKGKLKDERKGHRKLSEQQELAIRNHINSMPRCLPDDDDPTSSLQYLDEDLNIKTMYQLFKDYWAKKNPDTPPPSSSSYRRILLSSGLKLKSLENLQALKAANKAKPHKKRPSRSKKSKVEKKQQALDDQPSTFQMNVENFNQK
jgi:hypothetical protein